MNKQITLRCLSILSFLGVWWVGSLFSAPEILPGPLAIGKTIVSNFTMPGPENKSAEFHIAITLARILFTFSVAMMVGTAEGKTTLLNCCHFDAPNDETTTSFSGSACRNAL